MVGTSKADDDNAARSGLSGHQPSDNNTLQLPPSRSSLSVRSDYDDSSAGYITASSSCVSNLEAEPLTALPRINLESIHSSTPVKKQHASLARSPSSDSMTITADNSSNNTSSANLASLSSVTTFVPSTLTDLDTSDEDEDAPLDSDAGPASGDDRTAEFISSYDCDLRDPHKRTINAQNDNDDSYHQGDATEYDHTLTPGDVITVSHSHSTSINAYNDSTSHSRSASQPGSTFPHDTHSSFPMSLSSSWLSLALPPSAVKLHRKRRNILLRLLKTWEGREQVLHLTHSLILLLCSSLDHPVPQTYRGALMRPAGTLLAMSFPRPIRVALMQRIYTTAEGIDNFRRVILVARWVTAATEAVMDHWQHRQDLRRNTAERDVELESRLTGEEPVDKRADHMEGGVSWLQPPSVAPLDGAEEDEEKVEGGEQSFEREPAAKLGKVTGRGDATGAVGADVAENADAGPSTSRRGKRAHSSSTSLPRTFSRFWASLWRLSHLEAAAELLATVGEACETAAVLAGGGMFWRAVGIQRLGLPFLSLRRRQGIERLGIVLSLCSVLLSLLVLRMEHKALRSELRSAHRRIIRANDKLGWATDLAESDLRRVRRNLKLNFWEKIANFSESIFLSYEAAAPHIDKDGVEGWTGLLASAIRLSSLWRQIGWGLI
ncbi:hypothetical protein [Sporisorium scitamineum]|uniref:Uncharacterized protein n=1 Tax=Sporisorium scitamineum TaxID=49012 RepID=A0A0F7S902_9BASI|nr:hypothetical protein [Sporisorium scitamineum]